MTTERKELREGSASKRAAILAAARELFLSEGFDRVSVDAISARAGVSKRTVYDYFGDKRSLLVAVVEQAVAALLTAVRGAIDENLSAIDEPAELEPALVAFAGAITASAISSSDYSALMRLLSMESAGAQELRERLWATTEPEDSLAEAFVELDRRGLLSASDPRLAADHFVALTLASSVNTFGRIIDPDDSATHHMIVEGVRAFLRAYARPAP